MPRLDDDGRSVTLDLVSDVVAAAARAGRSTVRVVHGHSTTDALGSTRTIKSALLEALDRGALDAHVASDLRSDGHVLLGLDAATRPSPSRLRLADFW